jgi:DNA-binding NarL/FixJ family response regulator
MLQEYTASQYQAKNITRKIFVTSVSFEWASPRCTLSVLVTMSLRIVLADDSPPLLQRVISVLQHDFQVVATANNGNSALECVQQHDPDVIVLDVSMPSPNGIEVSRILQKSGARVKVVILTSHQDRILAQVALAAGALGYVSKDRILEDLIPAIRSAAQGTPFVSSSYAGAEVDVREKQSSDNPD